MLSFYSAILRNHLGMVCRFTPTCSEYARECISEFGFSKGLSLAARRIWRCRPGGSLGYDPIPLKESTYEP